VETLSPLSRATRATHGGMRTHHHTSSPTATYLGKHVRQRASKEGASKEGASKEGASKEGASKEGASKEGASKEGASKEGGSEGAEGADTLRRERTPGNLRRESPLPRQIAAQRPNASLVWRILQRPSILSRRACF
jgi:hypothetical protein